jgi:hypothetical protein
MHVEALSQYIHFLPLLTSNSTLQSNFDKRDSLKRRKRISGRFLCVLFSDSFHRQNAQPLAGLSFKRKLFGRFLCVLTRFTGRICTLQRHHPVSGSSMCVFPPAYRSSTVFGFPQPATDTTAFVRRKSGSEI